MELLLILLAALIACTAYGQTDEEDSRLTAEREGPPPGADFSPIPVVPFEKLKKRPTKPPMPQSPTSRPVNLRKPKRPQTTNPIGIVPFATRPPTVPPMLVTTTELPVVPPQSTVQQPPPPLQPRPPQMHFVEVPFDTKPPVTSEIKPDMFNINEFKPPLPNESEFKLPVLGVPEFKPPDLGVSEFKPPYPGVPEFKPPDLGVPEFEPQVSKFPEITTYRPVMKPVIPIESTTEKRPNVRLLYKASRRDEDGGYFFDFISEDSIHRMERGFFKRDPNTDDLIHVKTGLYSFESPEGDEYRVDFIADENGYRTFTPPPQRNPLPEIELTRSNELE